MNKTFEKIYSENNVILNKDMVLKENTALFEKVYAEAEMLNEMNPKLRALLAAGLIGTAGLGATSCSTPNDDYEEPTAIEQPATPETPEEIEDSEDSEEITDSEDSEDSENSVTFETLGVEEYAENLARAIKKTSSPIIVDTPFIDLVYDINEHGFVPAKFDETGDFIGNATGYIRYISPSVKTTFYVPESMGPDFDAAITAYKAAYAE